MQNGVNWSNFASSGWFSGISERRCIKCDSVFRNAVCLRGERSCFRIEDTLYPKQRQLPSTRRHIVSGANTVAIGVNTHCIGSEGSCLRSEDTLSPKRKQPFTRVALSLSRHGQSLALSHWAGVSRPLWTNIPQDLRT